MSQPRTDDRTASCAWNCDDVGGDSVWETSCGHAFQFNDGGPKENGFTFCGYCGGRIVEGYTSEAPIEDALALVTETPRPDPETGT